MDKLNISQVEVAFVAFLESLAPHLSEDKNYIIEASDSLRDIIDSLNSMEQKMLVVMLDELYTSMKSEYNLE